MPRKGSGPARASRRSRTKSSGLTGRGSRRRVRFSWNRSAASTRTAGGRAVSRARPGRGRRRRDRRESARGRVQGRGVDGARRGFELPLELVEPILDGGSRSLVLMVLDQEVQEFGQPLGLIFGEVGGLREQLSQAAGYRPARGARQWVRTGRRGHDHCRRIGPSSVGAGRGR